MFLPQISICIFVEVHLIRRALLEDSLYLQYLDVQANSPLQKNKFCSNQESVSENGKTGLTMHPFEKCTWPFFLCVLFIHFEDKHQVLTPEEQTENRLHGSKRA